MNSPQDETQRGRAMPLCKLLASFLFLLLASSPALSATTEILTRSLTSWNGGEFHYPSGTPEITAARIRLEAGEQTAWHCHTAPLFAYVLQGRLEISTDSGQQHVFKRGDAIIEVMDTWHRGTAIKGPVELVAFYAGILDVANTVLLSSGESCTDQRKTHN